MGTPMTIRDSSNIAAAEYDGAHGILQIVFHNGGVYEYLDVSPAEASEFSHAESPGSHFHRCIKGQKEYRKIG